MPQSRGMGALFEEWANLTNAVNNALELDPG
jgi:hypothetical protein